MKAIIPVAGKGTRLFPIGLGTPKCLVKILNKPIIHWNIDNLLTNGINEIIMVIGDDDSGLKFRKFIDQLLKQDKYQDLKVMFVVQTQKLGTAHVLQLTKECFKDGEKFIFLNGDDIYSPQCIKDVLSKEYACLGKKVTDPEKWGILNKDVNGRLINIVEKPKTFIGDLANLNCFKIDTRVFSLFDKIQKSPRGEFEITDTISLFAKEENIQVIQTDGYWYPIGYPWHMLDVTDVFMKDIRNDIQGEIEENVIIKGNIVLPKSSKILGNSYIEGNLMVGENTLIGPNVYIRGNVVIGNGCRIGFVSEIKNSVIDDNCRITQSYIGDSILGKNINFPMSVATGNNSSVIVDPMMSEEENFSCEIKSLVKDKTVSTNHRKFGAVIGDDVNVSIFTVIRPGVKIWTKSTTKPGEIVTRDIINQWS